MPVGSMPYLTRSGLPVVMLRSSFLRSSSSFSICSAPRRIRASCSSTLLTVRSLTKKNQNHESHEYHEYDNPETKTTQEIFFGFYSWYSCDSWFGLFSDTSG